MAIRTLTTPRPHSREGLVRGALRNPLYRSGYALVVNTGGTAVVGAAFWAVAAHLYSRQVLGRGSALIAALALVSGFAQLNLKNILPRFLPLTGRRATRFVIYSYGASTAAALVGGVIFVTALPRLSARWEFLSRSTLLTVVFVAATAVWGIFSLEDAVLLSMSRSVIVPVENAAYGLAKLLLLAGLASMLPAVGIFVSWVIPLAIVVPLINLLIFGRYLKDRDLAADVARVRPREVIRFASLDYVGTLFQSYGNLLPLLILSMLGPIANGDYYVASSIAMGLQMVASNFATSLLVEGSRAPQRLAELTRGILFRCSLATVGGAAVLALAAPLVLRLYGHEYAVHASLVLSLLAAGSVPFGLVSIAVALDRISGRVGRATATRAMLAILVLGASVLLLRHLGIAGVAIAWVGAHFLVAIMRTPTIARAIKRSRAVEPALVSASRQAPAAATGTRTRPPEKGLHRRPQGGRHRART